MQKNEGTLLHFGREKGLSPGSRLSRNHGELAWRTVRVLSCCKRSEIFKKERFPFVPNDSLAGRIYGVTGAGVLVTKQSFQNRQQTTMVQH